MNRRRLVAPAIEQESHGLFNLIIQSKNGLFSLLQQKVNDKLARISSYNMINFGNEIFGIGVEHCLRLQGTDYCKMLVKTLLRVFIIILTANACLDYVGAD